MHWAGRFGTEQSTGRGAWMLSEALVSDWSASCPVRGRLSPDVERLEVERRNLVWTLLLSPGKPRPPCDGGGRGTRVTFHVLEARAPSLGAGWIDSSHARRCLTDFPRSRLLHIPQTFARIGELYLVKNLNFCSK